MIRTFFSTQSRKAWVGGLLAAGLTPLLQLLAEGGSLNVGTAIAAVVTGALSAAGVYTASNEKNPADLAAEQERLQQAVDAAVAAAKAHVPAPLLAKALPVAEVVDHLLEEATKDFGGQSIGE